MPADSDGEVSVTGERSRARRDAEGRRNAIDLEKRQGKRSRDELAAVEERVATARSLCSEEVDERAKEMRRAALEQYERR